MKRLLFIAAPFVFLSISASAQWVDGQYAVRVVGQADFTTTTDMTVYRPYGVAVDVANGKLYVADYSSNRVLRFSYPVTANNPSPERAFGQPDMNTTTSGSTSVKMFRPHDVAVSSGTLWVSDYGNNRILKFTNAASASSDGPAAVTVLGQSDFSTNAPSTTAAGLSGPSGLFVDGSGNLWVADGGNNRVLRYNTAASKSSGASADAVLGQTTYITGGSTVSQSGMFSPKDVAMSGTSLFVADQGNNRVLRFDNVASKTNGGNADGVLGQSNFSDVFSGCTASTLNAPTRLIADNWGSLYVADYSNHRILIFSSAVSAANGASASNVLGQSVFTTNTYAAAANALKYPMGIAYDNTNYRLVVCDANNARMLVFQDGGGLPVTLTKFAAGAGANSIRLTWATATENQCAGFSIEKAIGEGDWRTLAFVQGSGNSAVMREYAFVDHHVSAGAVRYRLKQVNIDGSFEYSGTIETVFNGKHTNAVLDVFPNPCNPSTSITYAVPVSGRTRVTIYDGMGKITAVVFDGMAETGIYRTEWSGRNAASGFYFVRMQTPGTDVVKSLLLLK